MLPSDNCKNLIKHFEGCVLEAYKCPAGVLTIGWGHTGADVVPGMKITRAEADAIFDRDLEMFAAKVSALVKGVKLRQCQFDALVSLAYNIGLGALQRSTLLRIVRIDPDRQEIRPQFERWIHGGGRVLPGLVVRRRQEADLYFSGHAVS